jgi:hypothetical protein
MRILSLALLLAVTLFVIEGANQSNAGCVGLKCLQGSDPNPTIQIPHVDEPEGHSPVLQVHGNSCKGHTFNNVCDEPTTCAIGTDTADCAQPQSK